MATYTGHTSITVSDFDKSIDFYCNAVGLHVAVDFGESPAEPLTRNPDSTMRFALLAADDGLQCVEIFQFSGIEQRKLAGCARHEDYWSSHICFLTDEIDALYERMVSAGAKVDIPLTDSGGYKFAYLFDPDGYIVELVAK